MPASCWGDSLPDSGNVPLNDKLRHALIPPLWQAQNCTQFYRDLEKVAACRYPPKTSRKTVVRSSNACSPFPVKLEPCMTASVFGFRSANFLRIPAVIGV